MSNSKHLFALLRPDQWIKNLLLFLPAFFAQRISDFSLIWPLLTGIAAFSLLASTVYIFNDYCDMEI